MTFPVTGQLANEFFIEPPGLNQGDRYAPDFNNDVVPTAQIGPVVPVGQEDTVTVTWVADDQFGFIYDGVVIVATADTDDDTSAIALEVAANTALAGALAGQIASVSLVTNVLTVVSVAGSGAHTLADYEPDLTTVLIANTVAAASQALVAFGMGVVQDIAFPDLIQAGTSAVRQPATSADVLWGVMVHQFVPNYDEATLALLGLPAGALPPAPEAFQAVQRGRILVPWVGTLPTKGAAASVFWINDAAAPATERGAFRIDAAGVADAVPGAEIERVITRATGAFSGFVGLNFKTTL